MKTVRRIADVGVAVASNMLGVTLAGRRESRAHAAGMENH